MSGRDTLPGPGWANLESFQRPSRYTLALKLCPTSSIALTLTMTRVTRTCVGPDPSPGRLRSAAKVGMVLRMANKAINRKALFEIVRECKVIRP